MFDLYSFPGNLCACPVKGLLLHRQILDEFLGGSELRLQPKADPGLTNRCGRLTGLSQQSCQFQTPTHLIIVEHKGTMIVFDRLSEGVLLFILLRQGGENRPYLAQRAGLQAVPWAGDDQPAMAATYLVNDGLANEPPANAASSLFVLARFDRTRGYVPEWSEVRRYGNGTDREAFTYLGAMAGSAGRVDFVTRHDGSGVSLAASVADEGGRDIDWTEGRGVCSALALVDIADSN